MHPLSAPPFARLEGKKAKDLRARTFGAPRRTLIPKSPNANIELERVREKPLAFRVRVPLHPTEARRSFGRLSYR